MPSSQKPLIALSLPDIGVGGAEVVNVAIGQEIARRGFAVDLIAAREDPVASLRLPQSLNYKVINARRTRDAIIPISQYLRSSKPVAFVSSIWPFTAACALAHQLAASEARLVLWEHNMLSIQYADRGRLHNWFLRKSLAYGCNRANLCIGVSKGVCDDIISLSGGSKEKFAVIYNPVSVRNCEAKPEGDIIWQGWTGLRILSVGRFKSQKNHALLVRAFKKLLGRQDARLQILGDGPLRNQIEAMVHYEGISEKVLLPGIIDDPTPYYKSSDLFVLSSDYEGFGNVIVEALANGLPVVSTDCQSGPSEILDGGRFGSLVPVGNENALVEAMYSSLHETHHAEELIQRAADFTPEKIVDELLPLLLGQLSEPDIAMTET